jgi:uncharacterized protein YggE
MRYSIITILLATSALISLPANAQQTKGTVVMVSGSGEVKADNDQAQATFFVEEQDSDKTQAASRVNEKMKAGTAIIKKADPNGKLATRGYYTYPVYGESSSSKKERSITGWRVGQYLELTTKNIEQLPATVAAAQSVLALNGINFGLSDEARQRLDKARLNEAYKNMQDRAAIVAQAMGRKLNDASIELLEVDNANANRPEPRVFAATPMMKSNAAVPETNFEPGESTLTAHIVAKIKFN